MAWLYVDEFSRTGTDAQGQPVAAADYAYLVTQYRIAIGGASTPGPTFYGTTRFIQFHCDTTCSIAIAISPVAVVEFGRIAPNETRYVSATAPMGIAVIANT